MPNQTESRRLPKSKTKQLNNGTSKRNREEVPPTRKRGREEETATQKSGRRTEQTGEPGRPVPPLPHPTPLVNQTHDAASATANNTPVDYNMLPSPTGDQRDIATPKHLAAMMELNQQKTAEKKTWNSVDLKSKIVNRVHIDIWSRAKYSDFDKADGGNMKPYLQRNMGLTPQEFSNRWPTIRSLTNSALRTKRSYTVQLFKGSYFGKLCGVIFLAAFSPLQSVCSRLLVLVLGHRATRSW